MKKKNSKSIFKNIIFIGLSGLPGVLSRQVKIKKGASYGTIST